jgi:hypothetical protein
MLLALALPAQASPVAEVRQTAEVGVSAEGSFGVTACPGGVGPVDTAVAYVWCEAQLGLGAALHLVGSVGLCFPDPTC